MQISGSRNRDGETVREGGLQNRDRDKGRKRERGTLESA
eukprot:COSAG05_NODE_20052_length_283_cov_4.711957_1_plen_38_part_01